MAQSHADGRPSLPVELHSVTRTEHSALNRTIIARLPLCLPQATSTPALYAQGVAVFGQIYYGIEEAWDILLEDKTLGGVRRDMVTQLDVPRLRRSKRLNTSLNQLAASHHDQSLARRLAKLQAATSYFREAITSSILDRPHLLMAYTWTMYLALFNGGRFIAKQLLNAGTLFWNAENRAVVIQGPLSFWFFAEDGEYNGDDIKVMFKERFDAASTTLSNIERDEIITETKKLFALCAELVELLDTHTQADGLDEESHANFETSLAGSRSQSDFKEFSSPMKSWWRSVVNALPTSSTSLSSVLPQEIEQKQA